MARIFVSHSSKDNAKAQELFDWLRSDGHVEGFLDIDTEAGIQPGADWERKLYREVARSQAVIVLLTKHWMASKWCFAEFTQARALGKKIFPVIETPVGDELIGSDLQAIDLTSKREGGLKRLARAITESALASPEGFELAKGAAPFPGLDALGRDQAAVFFGRDDDIATLLERFRRSRLQGGARFLPILGASGSGKSSLLRAGLLPRLALDGTNWIVLQPMRPEGDPHRRLAAHLARAAEPGRETPARERRQALEDQLCGDAPSQVLRKVARSIRDHAGRPDVGIVIPVDQLEEAFTLAMAADREAFFALLTETLSPDLPFHVVATLRSEFLGQMQGEQGLRAPFEPYPLKPMPLERFGALVRGPARLAGLDVDDDVIAAILRDAGSNDALPLVAFTLRRLYDAERATGKMTLRGYEALGDAKAGLSPIENAVRQAAEEALPDLPRKPELVESLKTAFVQQLVRVNPDGDFVRRPAREEALPAAAHEAIDRLIDARLLVRRSASGDNSGAVIEVAHEALFRVWSRLADWLSEHRDFIVGKVRIEQARGDWQALPETERDQGLLRGILLDRARQWLGENPEAFDPDDRAYLERSIEADDARKQANAERRERIARLQRRVAVVASAAALVFALVGGFAGLQWQRAEEQTRTAVNALDAGTQTARDVVIDLARGFRDRDGVSSATISGILGDAIGLQRRMADLGGNTPALRAGLSLALSEIAQAHLQSSSAETGAGLEAAQAAAQEATDLARQLTGSEPDNPDWGQAQVSATIALGDAWLRAGDEAAAQAAFEDGLAHAERLAVTRPDDFAIQRDLALVLNRVADARVASGDEATAQTLYQRSLEIREGLMDAIRGDPERHSDLILLTRDLAISQAKIADIHYRAERIGDSLPFYRESIVLRSQLVELAPDNTRYRRDLAAGHQRAGAVAFQRFDYSGAANEFGTAETLFRGLVRSDPTRIDWRFDLSTVLENRADVSLATAQLTGGAAGAKAEAHQMMAESLAIRRQIAAFDPSNQRWKRGLAIALLKSGEIERHVGDVLAAVDAMRESLAISRALAEEDPKDAQAQLDIVAALTTLSNVEADPVPSLREAFDLLEALQAAGQLPATHTVWLDTIRTRLSALQTPE